MGAVVVLETSKGNIVVELDESSAPITTKNFLMYVNEGFYDGLVFHRVIKDFMIQTGGFTTDHDEKPNKAAITLESDNGLKNLAGTLAMARTNNPDSATSQFFINLRDNAFLDHAPGNDGYAVFGKVIEGMDIVQTIGLVPTTTKIGMSDWPVDDITIDKVYVKG